MILDKRGHKENEDIWLFIDILNKVTMICLENTTYLLVVISFWTDFRNC